MKSIVIYFSRAGGNYVSGRIVNLEVGNTEVAANIIKNITNSDIFKIEPVKEYSNDYYTCTDEAKTELKANERPEIKKYLDSIDEYDVIYLCYPCYWGTMPMPVFTFLENYDFTGKIIKPLCTHEGSGMGVSEKDIKNMCRGAIVKKGLPIVGSQVKESENIIRRWIEEE